jgi:Lar family restriction alleviation protein
MTKPTALADELKPCPFCGSKAENVSHHSCDCCGKRYTGVVRCTKCPAQVEHLDTSDEADAAWNTRLPPQHPDVREALEKIAAMDPKGIRADDLGRAARIASAALNGEGRSKPVDLRSVALAICKSRTCEGISCCQWPANMGRINCNAKNGAYDDAARAALAVVLGQGTEKK